MPAARGRGRAFDILTVGSAFVATFFSLATVLPNFNEDLRGSGWTLLVPTTAGALGAALLVAGIRWFEHGPSTPDGPEISRSPATEKPR